MGLSFLYCCAGKAEAGRDVVVFLSHGGGSAECVAAATHLVQRGVATLAITSNPGNQVHMYILIILLTKLQCYRADLVCATYVTWYAVTTPPIM